MSLTAASPLPVPASMDSRAEEKVVRDEPSEQDMSWLQEREILQRRLESAMVSNKRLGQQSDQTSQQKSEAEKALKKAQQDADRWQAVATQNSKEAAQVKFLAEEEVAQIRAEHEKAKADAEASRKESTLLRAKLEEGLQILEKAAKSGEKAEKARKEVVSKVFNEWEWSGTHREYTLRTTGKGVPSCPVCGQMDPNRVQHRDAGHTKQCWFPRFKKQLLQTLG